MTKTICAPRSTYISGRIEAAIPIPMKLTVPSSVKAAAVAKFALRQVQLEEERQHDQHEDRVHQPEGDRVDRRAEQLRIAPHGRHEGVLQRPLPALPLDRLGDELEDDRQVAPEDGADDQRQQQPVVALAAADEADTPGRPPPSR